MEQPEFKEKSLSVQLFVESPQIITLGGRDALYIMNIIEQMTNINLIISTLNGITKTDKKFDTLMCRS